MRGIGRALAMGVVVLAAPALAQDTPAAAVVVAPPSAAAQAIRARLSDRKLDGTQEEKQAAAKFFDARSGEPVFVDGRGLTARGTALLTELQHADEYGLSAASFEPGTLPAEGAALDAEGIADAEVRVTLAALKYARYARGGRIPEPPKQLATYLDRGPQLVEPGVVLEKLAAAADVGAALRGFNPQHPAFEALRKAYNEARAVTASGEEAGMPDGPSLRPGDRSPAVAIARKLLKHDKPAQDRDGKPLDGDVYDPALAAAVVAFQEANGLEPFDGIIGPRTRSALNSLKRPANRTLLANMEQWRWMPADLGDAYINVNIPEFTIRLVKGGTVMHTERVVTGLVTNQTPVFTDALQTVVLQPDWVLPESIKLNEALPSLLGGGGMFYSSGLKIKRGEREIDPWSVNWSSANLKAYTFYQPPGESNALGQVKFLFPNKHAVYMHDTPSKHLFDSPVRAYSHGCMRVRNPVKLAQLVLMLDKEWPPEKVQALIDDGPEDNRVALDHPIPVHVTYFTAAPDETGKVRTFRDIYGHEERISLALEGRWGEIDIPPDHLAPIEDREFEVRSAAYERRRERDEERQQYQRYQQYKGGGGEIEKALKGLFGGF